MESTRVERRVQPALSETPAFVAIICLGALCAAYWLMLTKVYYFTNMQAAEIAVYILSAVTVPGAAVCFYVTRRTRRENRKVHPPLVMSPARDRKLVEKAWDQNAVVLGYNIHGEPWLWTDKVRTMQGIVLGMTGSGKTTLLKNIITQDLTRRTGPPDDRHKIPIVIFDGKGDLDILPGTTAVHPPRGKTRRSPADQSGAAGASMPVQSLPCRRREYMAQVNMVFGSLQSAR